MANIIGIERLRIESDGKGVASLVGFWGCPLHCRYCLNPQCHQRKEKGLDITAEQLYKVVQRDEVYFRMSGGGVVFGGGEPLLQSGFIKKFSKLVAGKWEIRVETSLNVSWRHVEQLIDVIDEWIIDVKDANPEIYKQYTGKDNKRVIQNCKKLSERVPRQKIHIRIPHIPGYNTEEDVNRSIEFYRENGKIEVFRYVNNQ